MAQQPTAAGALYPNLKSGTPEPVQRRHGHDNGIAQTMYPRPKAQPPNPARESLRRHLQEAARGLDEIGDENRRSNENDN